jgi:membrane glycosyltransferase
VDAVNRDDRGQALLMAVVVLALAAATIAGLRIAQDRILAAAEQRRAGEAAVEAATAVIADAYVAELRAAPERTPDVARAVTADDALAAARAAASEISDRNGGAMVDDVTVRCDHGSIEVSLLQGGRAYRAGFGAPECSQR